MIRPVPACREGPLGLTDSAFCSHGNLSVIVYRSTHCKVEGIALVDN